MSQSSATVLSVIALTAMEWRSQEVADPVTPLPNASQTVRDFLD